MPRYARVQHGQRAFGKQRRNYGQNITLLAGLRLDGMSAAMVVEGPVNTAVFEGYIQRILLPTLTRGDIVVLDNLAVHKSRKVRAWLHVRGCRLLFLSAYSPDLFLIENAFAKIKQFLRRTRAQTVDALYSAIQRAIDTISIDDAIGFFCSCWVC